MARRPSTSPRAVARRVVALAAMQHQVRVELKDVQPAVWRRLLVPENVTLTKLHLILQAQWVGMTATCTNRAHQIMNVNTAPA